MSNATRTPVHPAGRTASVPPRAGGARGTALLSLGLAVLALVAAPVLVLIPVVGFVPPAIAALGLWLGCRALRTSGDDRTLPVLGIAASATVLALTGFVALMWALSVVNPAIGQYTELHRAVGDAVERVLTP